MNIDLIIKLVGIVGSSFVLWKTVSELKRSVGINIREDYKFAKEFLEERQRNPNLHPLLIELGYLGITHDRTIKPEEAEYLLSFKRPDRALSRFKQSRRYVDFCVTRIDKKN
jgi:hypothetical protein